MFTVGESPPILLIQIMYNAVKILRDGLASKHLSALYAIHVYSSNVMNWVKVRLLPSKLCLFSSNISLNSFLILRQKKVKILLFPPPPPSFCDFVLSFFNLIVPTYWLVSICLYYCPFTPSRGVAINVFLVITKIRLTNKNDVIVQIGYLTVFWKENIHGDKYVN